MKPQRGGGAKYACLAALAAAGLVCAFPAAGSADELTVGQTAGPVEEPTGLTWSGYYKNFLVAFVPARWQGQGAPGPQPAEGLVHNAFRLKGLWQPCDALAADLAYELTAAVSDQGLSALLFGLPQQRPAIYRFADLDAQLAPAPGEAAGNFTLLQNLDRLSLTLSPAFGDITLGRQPIAFGSARVVNPTDVLAPFTFETLDKEERVGVDALRVKIAVGPMGETDAGYVFGHYGNLDQSAAFLHQRLYLWRTDLSLLALAFRENLLLGVDVARAVGGAGAWLEAAYTLAGYFQNYAPDQNYLRLSAGLDYNLASGLYALVEYHYNGAGAAEIQAYATQALRPAYSTGAVYLLGRHYLAPGFTYQVSTLLSLTGQVLVNLTDPSAIVTPTLTYSFADNVVLIGGVFFSLGAAPQVSAPALPVPEIRSEFGTYPTIYYSSIKLYF